MHETYYETFDENTPRSEIFKEMNETCKERSDYNAGIYGKIRYFENTILNSCSEAEDFIYERDSHDYDSYAVRFKELKHDVLTNDKTYQKIMSQLEVANQENFKAFGKNYFKDRTSKTIGCNHCGSKLNKDYIKGHNCPLCNTTLLSPTISKSLDRKRAKVEELKTKGWERRTYLVNNPKNFKIKWLVKIEYHV